MKLDIIDAFVTGQAFSGNPAAVVRTAQPLTTELMQQIAAQHNLSETAFISPLLSGSIEQWQIRWFSPLAEVDLCGHATMAAAYAILSDHPTLAQVHFHSLKHGRLSVARHVDGLCMDFPIQTQRRVDEPPTLLTDAIPTGYREVFLGVDWLVVYDDPHLVINAQPDLTLLQQLPHRGVILTSVGAGSCDFISRFFAPKLGIPEDPVTGSAHCSLAPYWCVRLQRQQVYAWQASARGGLLTAEVIQGRVNLIGHCRLYSRGWIYLDNDPS
ncbi:MAG: PhzF family phenazine biosynthesis protein [Pseudomonadota bacterium]|nr:PhzF family phenazine biosynthesis protein [Pseudomonadota bacterium]